MNGYPGNLHIVKGLKTITVTDHTLHTKVFATDKSVLPQVQNIEKLTISNITTKPQTITLLLPLWFADPAFSSASAILENFDLKIVSQGKNLKLAEPHTLEDPTHFVAKLFIFDIKLSPKETAHIELMYKLFMSSTTLNLHEVFNQVYESELEELDMGSILGINLNYAHNLDLKLPAKVATRLPGITNIKCDLRGLQHFLADNKNLMEFLKQETSSTQVFNDALESLGVRTISKASAWDEDFNPLRIIELREFPKSNDSWIYSWTDPDPNFVFEAYVLIMPTSFHGFKRYYEHFARLYDSKQKMAWEEQLKTIYSEAAAYPINDQSQLEEILKFLD